VKPAPQPPGLARHAAPIVAALAVFWFLPATAAAAPPPPQPAKPVKYYVVEEEYQGEPEFLFEIAQRFLGDGDRDLEIFELNKGRPEPDGATVTDAEKILPGWILQLPPDAKGPGVREGQLPSVSDPGDDEAANSDPPDGSDQAGSTAGSAFRWWPLGLAVAGGLALAGCAVATVLLRRRGRLVRRPRAATAPAAGPGDLTASWTADRALRALATACAQAGRPLPSLYAVAIGRWNVTVRLTAADENAPAAWSPDGSARTWSASLAELQTAAVDLALGDPYPRLVTAGVSGGQRILLDLSQAGGVIGLDGDPRVQRTILDMWSAELASNPWSQDVPVVRIGFGGSSPENLRDAPAMLTEARGGVLLIASPLTGREAAELQSLLGTPGWDWAVVVAGSAPDARWRFTASPDGHVDTGFLGISLYAGQAEPVVSQ
jgi:hypothetical protein